MKAPKPMRIAVEICATPLKANCTYTMPMPANTSSVSALAIVGIFRDRRVARSSPKNTTDGKKRSGTGNTNKMIGRKYPWNKYAQIMIADFMYGGMENTTATTLNDAYMVDQRGLLDFNPDGVISHEAGHQWYGDLITNRSWGHLWLHESYASYLEARFMGSYYGDEQYARETYDNGLSGVNADRERLN